MGRMPRALDGSGGVYHVYNRGNNRSFIFNQEEDVCAFRNIILRYKREMRFKLFHHVIMGNHFHLIICPDDPFSLSEIMQRILPAYTRHYKKRHGFAGQLWQGRFKSKIIDDDGYLLTCGIYVELNPLRTATAEEPERYRWSSYRYYAYGENDGLTDADPFYETLGGNDAERRIAYRAMTKMWRYMGKPVPASP